MGIALTVLLFGIAGTGAAASIGDTADTGELQIDSGVAHLGEFGTFWNLHHGGGSSNDDNGTSGDDDYVNSGPP